MKKLYFDYLGIKEITDDFLGSISVFAQFLQNVCLRFLDTSLIDSGYKNLQSELLLYFCAKCS